MQPNRERQRKRRDRGREEEKGGETQREREREPVTLRPLGVVRTGNILLLIFSKRFRRIRVVSSIFYAFAEFLFLIFFIFTLNVKTAIRD